MLPCSTSALLLLNVLLVQSSELTCRIGNRRECDAAPFVPGHSLVGQSFDIVTLQRKKAHVIDVKNYLSPSKSCQLCTNPLQNDVEQKLPSSVVDWSASSQCKADIISNYHTSISSLMKAYISQETNVWTFGLKIDIVLFDNSDVGGTGSYVYKFVSQRSKEDRYTYSLHTVSCKHYEFILSTTPALSEEFKKQLDILPSHYNSSTMNEYIKLIQIYGTHYFRTVHLGGRLRRVTSSRSCLSTLNGLTSSEAHSCLSMGVAVGLGKMKISSVKNSCIRALKNQDVATNFSSGLHQHYTDVSGGVGWLGEFSLFQNDSKAYMKWLMSLKEHPDVVSYSLRPLYQLVPSQHQKAGLKAAIEKYLKDSAVKKSPPEPHCEGNTPNLASNCCPLLASRGTLSVIVVQAWDLFGDDHINPTDSYAKMFYGSYYGKTKMIQSNNPWWNAQFNVGRVDTTHDLIIEIWDQDWKYWREDDLLVNCVKYIYPGTHSFKCQGTYGFLEFKYTLTCDPYLTGKQCRYYQPSP